MVDYIYNLINYLKPTPTYEFILEISLNDASANQIEDKLKTLKGLVDRSRLKIKQPQPNVDVIYQPICEVLVAELNQNETEQKPCWLLAIIKKEHLNTGESTSKNTFLRKKIVSRGKKNDQCGHIVAKSLGGKMVDFNLFPQDAPINMGFKHNELRSFIYWKGVDTLIHLFLSVIPEKYCPKVKYEALLNYNDDEFPDRPSDIKLLVKFYCKGIETSNEVDRAKMNEVEMSLISSILNNIEKMKKDENYSLSKDNYKKAIEFFGDLKNFCYDAFALDFLKKLMESYDKMAASENAKMAASENAKMTASENAKMDVTNIALYSIYSVSLVATLLFCTFFKTDIKGIDNFVKKKKN